MWLKQLMLSWIIQIWILNLNHKNFKILTQIWHWNYTKMIHQLIVINFSNLLPLHRFFFSRHNCTLILFDLSFFCILNFDSPFFSLFFITLQTTQIHSFRIFLQRNYFSQTFSANTYSVKQRKPTLELKT